MIERAIIRKLEEARTQGWRQQVLSRFLKAGFRLVTACGLTDVTKESADSLLAKEDRNWSEQAERLINLGFHAELGMSEDKYRATIPAFQPQQLKYKRRFDHPLLIDTRVSLQRQLELHKVKVDSGITKADLVRISMWESTKQHIPGEPYQLWVKVDLRTYEEAHRSGDLTLRTHGEFTYDERGLTPIEGLALLREAPDVLYKGFLNFQQDGMYLLDSVIGEDRVLTLKPIGSIRLPGQVAILSTDHLDEYTSSYNLVSCAKLPKK